MSKLTGASLEYVPLVCVLVEFNLLQAELVLTAGVNPKGSTSDCECLEATGRESLQCHCRHLFPLATRAVCFKVLPLTYSCSSFP